MPRQRPHQRSSGVGARAVIFGVLALVLVGTAAYALWPKEGTYVDYGLATGAGPTTGHEGMGHGDAPVPTGRADIAMRVDMDGFHPATLTVPVGRQTRLMLINPDNSMHSDGGGVHEFAVPGLGIDVKVPPQTNMLITLPATAAPGEYSFYCDTCCGGKENPSMQGTLTVG
ncbi:MAG: cupredoxin domain-containing protein [Chloroflexota bacterium]|nr:cupredoxin domain-containing protein [Chloroflexota bacterium]